MVCLANSWREGGRCIAGLRLDGTGWLRPVSNKGVGQLYPEHYTMNNGLQIGLLDVAEIELSKATPSLFQPENWLLKTSWFFKKRWRFIRKMPAEEALSFLSPYVVQGPDVLAGTEGRIPYDSITEQYPITRSVALIRPRNLRWHITENYNGNRQTRAIFALNGASYNLVVTDPVWQSRLSELPFGTHTVETTESNRMFLTVSLGAPTSFDNNCYKLVAAVVALDESG